MIGVFFITTAWGRKNGGINTINYGLIKALAKRIKDNKMDWKLYCIVTDDEVNSDISDEELNNGIIIKCYKEPENSKQLIKLVKDEKFEQIFWVGHDIITGQNVIHLSQKIKKSFSIIIHHMSYSMYYYMRNKDPEKISQKEEEQALLLPEADMVMAIGPVLLDSAKDILNNSDKYNGTKVEEIIPGLEDIKPNCREHNVQTILVAGRIDGNNLLKQIPLALDAIGTYIKKRPEKNDRIKAEVYGFSDNAVENQKKVMDELYNVADRVVNIKGLKYIENEEKLFQKIRNSDLCIMPSVQEGFGLVAYEAIAAGVPVIISKSSGLYKFLQNKTGNKLDGYVKAIDIQGNPVNEERPYTDLDLKHLEEIIAEVLNNYAHYKALALELREHLLNEEYTWDFCAGTFIESLNEKIKKTNIDTSDKMIKRPILKKDQNLTEYLNTVILPNFCKLVVEPNKVQCKIIKYSNDHTKRFTVFSSDYNKGGKWKTREIDEGTVGVMNRLIREGITYPVVLTDFVKGICYSLSENAITVVKDANLGVPDHHALKIIAVPIIYNNMVEGALTFDIFSNELWIKLDDKSEIEIIKHAYNLLRMFSEILAGYFYNNIIDDIRFGEAEEMIRKRVLVSFGGKCPLGCKHCFTQDVLNEGNANILEIVKSIEEEEFDVIYVSHYKENFYNPEAGVELCEKLYETYKTDICITTRCVLSGEPLHRIVELNKTMRNNGNKLTFCISIPAMNSYEKLENGEMISTPNERIEFAKKLKKSGIMSLITLRPLCPDNFIPIQELKEIIDLSYQEVDGYLTGGLIVTDTIIEKMGLKKEELEFLEDEQTEYLEGVNGVFFHVDIKQELNSLFDYCNEKQVKIFKHSMEALNFLKGK